MTPEELIESVARGLRAMSIPPDVWMGDLNVEPMEICGIPVYRSLNGGQIPTPAWADISAPDSMDNTLKYLAAFSIKG